MNKTLYRFRCVRLSVCGQYYTVCKSQEFKFSKHGGSSVTGNDRRTRLTLIENRIGFIHKKKKKTFSLLITYKQQLDLVQR